MLKPARKALFVLLSLLILTPTLASAAGRYALVIGNSAYTGSAPLKNPKNDAELISETLTTVGFEVIKVTDASQKQMRRAMLDFSRRLRNDRDSIGLFYYAGHGLQVSGINYMVPVTADIKDEDEVRFEGVDVNDFLNTMRSSKSRLNIVILDACRNNPYARSFRSASRGLAPVQATRGSLIAYSTAPGDVAFDGNGLNSPYTLALSRFIRKPGLKVETVFKRVLSAVGEATGKKQTPWLSSSFSGEFFFAKKKKEALENPAGQTSPPATTTANTPKNSGTGTPQSLEKLFWESIVNSSNPASFQAYVTAFPNGTFVPLAKIKIAELQKASKKTVVASVTKPASKSTTNRSSEPFDSSGASQLPQGLSGAQTPPSPPKQGDNTLTYRSVFPGSSVKALTRAMVEPLNCHKLWIARNEIDYRNGLCFKSEKGIRYFDNSNCTSPKVKLTPLEYRNKRTIRTWEIRKRCRLKKIFSRIKTKRPPRLKRSGLKRSGRKDPSTIRQRNTRKKETSGRRPNSRSDFLE